MAVASHNHETITSPNIMKYSSLTLAASLANTVTVESDIVRLGDIADDDKLKMKMFFNDKDD